MVSGVLAALNELRHCAPINLKATLALELQCALQSVANSLLRYNATRIVKDSEKTLFLAMCRAFIEVLEIALLLVLRCTLDMICFSVRTPLFISLGDYWYLKSLGYQYLLVCQSFCRWFAHIVLFALESATQGDLH